MLVCAECVCKVLWELPCGIRSSPVNGDNVFGDDHKSTKVVESGEYADGLDGSRRTRSVIGEWHTTYRGTKSGYRCFLSCSLLSRRGCSRR